MWKFAKIWENLEKRLFILNGGGMRNCFLLKYLNFREIILIEMLCDS
jgi:hypothetical protein